MKRILVWDLPVRLFHWILVALVIGATTTALIGGNWMTWHGRCGVMIVGLLAFRIAWGLLGSTTARFLAFVRGPGAIRDYLAGRWQGIGHNPLGALSVIGMLAVLTAQAATGLFSNDDIAFNGPLYPLVTKATSDWLAGLHQKNAWLLGFLVLTHLGAIAFYTWIRKESLVLPMVVGTRDFAAATAPEPTAGGSIGGLVLSIAIGAAAAWAASGALLPPPPPQIQAPATAAPNW